MITDRGTYEAAHVVLAAGAESRELASSIGLALPIRSERRRLLFTAPVRTGLLPPLLVASERAFAAKQLTSGVIYMGWLKETSASDDLTFIEEALRAGSTLMPLLADVAVRRVVSGPYDMTPDRRPLLGPVPGYDGIHLATGFSGHGFMIAPAAGEIVAASIVGKRPAIDAFAVARFSRQAHAEGLFI